MAAPYETPFQTLQHSFLESLGQDMHPRLAAVQSLGSVREVCLDALSIM